MKKQTILLVDSNSESRKALGDFLKRNLLMVEDTDTGNNALQIINDQDIDLVLLDMQLPDIYGIELCKCISERKPNLPIIFVAYAIDEIESILCLESGASDYIEKPYNHDILLARINAIFRVKEIILKKSQASLCLGPNININNFTTIKFGNWIYYPQNSSFTYLDYPQKDLTQLENKILNLLLSNPNHIFNRADIATQLEDATNQNSKQNINVRIHHLRKTLTQLHNAISPIKAVRSKGYTMDSFLDYYYDDVKALRL